MNKSSLNFGKVSNVLLQRRRALNYYYNVISSKSPTLKLYAWEGTTVDGSNRVAAWDDAVTSISFTQATADNKPLLTADANGVPVIRFDGTSSQLSTTSLGTDFYSADYETTFLVYKKGTITPVSNARIFAGGNGEWNAKDMATSLTVRNYNVSTTSYVVLDAGSLAVGDLVIATYGKSNTNSYLNVNGGADVTSSVAGPYNNIEGIFSIGGISLNPDYFFQGDLYAIVAFSTALSEADRTAVYNALSKIIEG